MKELHVTWCGAFQRGIVSVVCSCSWCALLFAFLFYLFVFICLCLLSRAFVCFGLLLFLFGWHKVWVVRQEFDNPDGSPRQEPLMWHGGWVYPNGWIYDGLVDGVCPPVCTRAWLHFLTCSLVLKQAPRLRLVSMGWMAMACTQAVCLLVVDSTDGVPTRSWIAAMAMCLSIRRNVMSCVTVWSGGLVPLLLIHFQSS